MDYEIREKYLTRILSGVVRCVYNKKTYLIREPDFISKMIAQEIFEENLRDSSLLGVNTDEEMVQVLIEKNLWSESEQIELDALPKRIENQKVKLYQAYFYYKNRDKIRKALNGLKIKYENLMFKRESLKKESCQGYALALKNKYLICSNVSDLEGNVLWGRDDYSSLDGSFVDFLTSEYFKSRVDEEQIRELARTDPWRTIWGAGKASGDLFGLPATKLTGEQKTLITWSRIYDNVYESPECPPDEVVEDNDVLDGWLIVQSKKRDEERKKSHGNQPAGKHKDSGEVFLFADTPEDAKRIQNLNDAQGKMIMKERMGALQRAGGKLDEWNMPDSKRTVVNQGIQQIKNRSRK